ncbi:hypothetical protein [Streptomyces pinistramenti]|uniref:hypothetical protein n=1 Tax=Streptomyces pinistramenti TaxID=2884812 RepID=UPI001D08CA93|nr:hypothetical protein [Streptomyces pinistramenti]MCB5911499.1 hypothetical protein [Streptomyces pinistramenti]
MSGARPSRSAPPQPAIDESYEDKLEVVATGHCVAIFPPSDRRAAVREDIALVPVVDTDPCEVVLVTRADAPNPLLGSLEDVAHTLLGTVSTLASLLMWA